MKHEIKTSRIFSEVKKGFTTGSLFSVISKSPLNNEKLIIDYLQKGIVLIISPGIIYDILDNNKPVISNGNILTDGIWAWPNYLAYYVKKYHVQLPKEFISHMIKNKWKIVDKTKIDISNLHL